MFLPPFVGELAEGPAVFLLCGVFNNLAVYFTFGCTVEINALFCFWVRDGFTESAIGAGFEFLEK